VPRAARAGEPSEAVVAPAHRKRPGTQVPLAERVLAGVPPDATAELTPEHRCAELIADDGAHGPPAPHGRQPLGRQRRRRRGRRRNCRARGRLPLGGRPPSWPEARRRCRGQVPRREGIRRNVRPPQRNGFSRRLRRLPPCARLRRLPPSARLQTLPPSARFWRLSPCSGDVTAKAHHRQNLTLRAVTVRRPPAG
jgi:hypothetical protein